MSDVSLTAAVRQNLLSLQNTTDLINRTQNRLSTGLRVANAIDDPVKFFQAKGLQDRASDFEEKKTGIDQGLSTLSTATDAIVAIENLVQQLKGLATNAKSATTDSEVANIVTQFNDLRTQINNLTTDAVRDLPLGVQNRYFGGQGGRAGLTPEHVPDTAPYIWHVKHYPEDTRAARPRGATLSRSSNTETRQHARHRRTRNTQHATRVWKTCC